jgi:hypothetical protein
MQISIANPYLHAPKPGSCKLLNITEESATLNFDAIVQRSLEILRGKVYLGKFTQHEAYSRALQDAEETLAWVRARLNEAVARWRANRRVSRHDRRDGFSPCTIITFPVAPRVTAITQAAAE